MKTKWIVWAAVGIFALLMVLFIGLTVLSRPAPTQTDVSDRQAVGARQANWRNTTMIYLGASQFYLLDRLDPQSDGAPKALWAFPNDSLASTFRRIKQKTDMTLGPDSLVFVVKPLQSASYKNVVSALDDLAEAKVRRYALEDKLTEAEENLLKTISAQ